MEVDYIVPLTDGGEVYELNKLQILCRACHVAKTREENLAQRPTPSAVAKWQGLVEETVTIR